MFLIRKATAGVVWERLEDGKAGGREDVLVTEAPEDSDLGAPWRGHRGVGSALSLPGASGGPHRGSMTVTAAILLGFEYGPQTPCAGNLLPKVC